MANSSGKRHPGGAVWEAAAQQHLERSGLTLVSANYRCTLGEMDLIMDDGGTLAFIEVRYRRREQFGGGFGSVDRAKQLRLAKVASWFLKSNPRWLSAPCRFDVVAVSGTHTHPDIQWLRHAFEDPRP